MKVYITKYALTTGIIEREVEVANHCSTMVSFKNEHNYFESYHKPDWFETKVEAITRAELMKTKKIESLKKQIKKLEKLQFEL